MKGLSEIDMIIHYMRQSKMSDIRAYLEKLHKQRNGKNPVLADVASVALREIHLCFKEASKDAPMS